MAESLSGGGHIGFGRHLGLRAIGLGTLAKSFQYALSCIHAKFGACRLIGANNGV